MDTEGHLLGSQSGTQGGTREGDVQALTPAHSLAAPVLSLLLPPFCTTLLGTLYAALTQ